MSENLELHDLLERHADAVVARWCDEVLAQYPDRAYAAWTREQDRFANPVGHSVRTGTRGTFAAVLSGGEPGALRAALDEMIRIRAVQQMSATAAVGFVFMLRDIIHDELGKELADARLRPQVAELERRIDAAALAAFDLYAEHRQRLSELRISELKRNIPWAVGRAGQAEVERELG
jgi:RsbT co-antagonist protein rsbRD N-terminal domain